MVLNLFLCFQFTSKNFDFVNAFLQLFILVFLPVFSLSYLLFSITLGLIGFLLQFNGLVVAIS